MQKVCRMLMFDIILPGTQPAWLSATGTPAHAHVRVLTRTAEKTMCKPLMHVACNWCTPGRPQCRVASVTCCGLVLRRSCTADAWKTERHNRIAHLCLLVLLRACQGSCSGLSRERFTGHWHCTADCLHPPSKTLPLLQCPHMCAFKI